MKHCDLTWIFLAGKPSFGDESKHFCKREQAKIHPQGVKDNDQL